MVCLCRSTMVTDVRIDICTIFVRGLRTLDTHLQPNIHEMQKARSD